MRHVRASLFGLIVLLFSGRVLHAQSSSHEALVSLAREVIYTQARLYPMQATTLGIPGFDAQLETPSEAYRAAYVQSLRKWQEQLHAIVRSFNDSTSLTDRDDARLLDAQLTRPLNALLVYQLDRKDYAAPAESIVNAIFIQFTHLPTPEKGARQGDLARAWADITARLEKTPAYLDAAARLATMPCHLFGVIGVKELAGAPDLLNGALTDAARSQLGSASAAFARFSRARDAAVAAIARVRAHVDAQLHSWPENYAMGREAYDRMLREEQLLPFDAADIERMARDELAHGWAEEAWLASVSRRSGVPFGAASGGGMAPAGPALIDYYRERIAELTRFVAQADLLTLPGWLGAIKVMETPAFMQPVSPGASMDPPRLFASSTTGYYYITPPKSLADAAARLDMNEDFDRDRILSTAAHEVMPGHFLQLSIAKRHPDFIRRIQDATAFIEGWAFYGEEMMVRLGLYGTDLDARLDVARWERVRGARAIVDAKLARGEWSYDEAVDFFVAQTGFTRSDAEAGVGMIAEQAGYVIAYTVGRYQLESLLAEYMLKMGARGSLHDFHDRLLSYGSTPFAILGPELLADLDKPAAQVRAAANY